VPLYEQAIEIGKQVFGARHPNVATTTNNLAWLYSQQGNYAAAEPLFQQVLEITRQSLGDRHPDVATVLNTLAKLYYAQSNYAAAEPLLQQALEIFRQSFGDRHPDVATVLNTLGLLYYFQGNYAAAEPLLQQALELSKQAFGARHPNVATALTHLAELYRLQGNYADAEPLYQQALEIYKQVLGDRHPLLANTLNGLANLYQDQGNYAATEPLYQQAIEISKQTLGDRHPNVASGLNNLAVLYQDQGKYAAAESLFRQALVIRQTLGERHPDVIGVLQNLAKLYCIQGNYTVAEPLYQQALEIYRQTLDDRHPNFAALSSNLAELYTNQGNYAAAEPLFQQALEIYRQTFDDRHPNVATALNNLAELYYVQGNHTAAEPFFQQALEICRQTLGDRHPNFATTLSNLMELYFTQGNYAAAEPLAQQALEIYKQTLGDRHPKSAIALKNLAELYRVQDKYTAAEPLYQQALEIYRETFGDRHPSVATGLCNLANLHQDQGNYVMAEFLYKQALEIYRQVHGDRHPLIALLLNNLAGLYQNQGNQSLALNMLERSTEIEESDLNLNLITGSDVQKIVYMRSFSRSTNVSLSLHLQFAPDNITAARLALTTHLRRKGRILDAISSNLQNLRQNLTPENQSLLDRLQQARTQLSSLIYGGIGDLTPEQYRTRIDQLTIETDQLENTLAQRSVEFRSENQPVTIAAIQSKIPDDAALIELVLYCPFNPRSNRSEQWGNPRYAAYILQAQGEPLWVDLGEAAILDRQIAAFRQVLTDDGGTGTPSFSESRVRQSARALDTQLMQPIRAKLGNVQHLLISPDSQLNLVPFAALVDEQNRYLIETYTITYLTTGRDLLRSQGDSSNRQPPVIIANPDFATPGSAELAPIATRTTSNNRRSSDLASLKVTPLPSTGSEAEAIAALLPNATLLTQSNATENALKQLQSPSILHIATHGFFLPNVPIIPRLANAVLTDSSAPSLQPIENPMLRSGLALAGFNLRQSGSEDGVFTALEAAGLRLGGTQLVALSACETGLGNVANGDGVYGLRRAFVIAGAESLLMSLWRVSDDGTQSLMTQYYQQLLQQKVGRSEALRNVQLRMLKDTENPLYHHPYYWAAFLLSGNWQAM
jgi:tetratricopeptide (TPR) repeat protein